MITRQHLQRKGCICVLAPGFQHILTDAVVLRAPKNSERNSKRDFKRVYIGFTERKIYAENG